MFQISPCPFVLDVEFLPEVSLLVKFEVGGRLSLLWLGQCQSGILCLAGCGSVEI